MYVGPWQEFKLMKVIAEVKAENAKLKARDLRQHDAELALDHAHDRGELTGYPRQAFDDTSDRFESPRSSHHMSTQGQRSLQRTQRVREQQHDAHRHAFVTEEPPASSAFNSRSAMQQHQQHQQQHQQQHYQNHQQHPQQPSYPGLRTNGGTLGGHGADQSGLPRYEDDDGTPRHHHYQQQQQQLQPSRGSEPNEYRPSDYAPTVNDPRRGGGGGGGGGVGVTGTPSGASLASASFHGDQTSRSRGTVGSTQSAPAAAQRYPTMAEVMGYSRQPGASGAPRGGVSIGSQRSVGGGRDDSLGRSGRGVGGTGGAQRPPSAGARVGGNRNSGAPARGSSAQRRGQPQNQARGAGASVVKKNTQGLSEQDVSKQQRQRRSQLLALYCEEEGGSEGSGGPKYTPPTSETHKAPIHQNEPATRPSGQTQSPTTGASGLQQQPVWLQEMSGVKSSHAQDDLSAPSANAPPLLAAALRAGQQFSQLGDAATAMGPARERLYGHGGPLDGTHHHHHHHHQTSTPAPEAAQQPHHRSDHRGNNSGVSVNTGSVSPEQVRVAALLASGFPASTARALHSVDEHQPAMLTEDKSTPSMVTGGVMQELRLRRAMQHDERQSVPVRPMNASTPKIPTSVPPSTKVSSDVVHQQRRQQLQRGFDIGAPVRPPDQSVVPPPSYGASSLVSQRPMSHGGGGEGTPRARVALRGVDGPAPVGAPSSFMPSANPTVISPQELQTPAIVACAAAGPPPAGSSGGSVEGVGSSGVGKRPLSGQLPAYDRIGDGATTTDSSSIGQGLTSTQATSTLGGAVSALAHDVDVLVANTSPSHPRGGGGHQLGLGSTLEGLREYGQTSSVLTSESGKPKYVINADGQLSPLRPSSTGSRPGTGTRRTGLGSHHTTHATDSLLGSRGGGSHTHLMGSGLGVGHNGAPVPLSPSVSAAAVASPSAIPRAMSPGMLGGSMVHGGAGVSPSRGSQGGARSLGSTAHSAEDVGDLLRWATALDGTPKDSFGHWELSPQRSQAPSRRGH